MVKHSYYSSVPEAEAGGSQVALLFLVFKDRVSLSLIALAILELAVYTSLASN